MDTPRIDLHRQAGRILRVVVLMFSAGVFACALYMAWLAFSNPVELEIREGTVWIHVLAKRAGVDIYETTQVAFVNMNHGPLDPILKTWISTCLPVLPGYMVTRVFVLLLPVVLFAAAYSISRRQLAVSMLAAGTLCLFFDSQLAPFAFVGRSDATALCALAVAGVLAHRLLVTRHRNWSNRRYIATQIGLGAASAAAFLINWRYATVLALQFVVLSTQFYDAGAELRPPGRPLRAFVTRALRAARDVALSMAFFVVGAAAVWLPVFFFELHGSLETFYKRFIGFFVADNSGWGLYGGDKFRIIPNELLPVKFDTVCLFGVFILIGLYRLRSKPLELVAWLLMLAATWTAISYGFFKNRGGGGTHYFYEFFTFALIFILHAFCRRQRWGPFAQLLVVGVIALVLPWRLAHAWEKTLAESRAKARTFRADVERLTQGQPVFGEEAHLFKKKYAGEVVDMGDTSAAIARSAYFGEALTRTYEDYARKLAANPPKFVIGGLLEEATPERIMSPELQDLLKKRYTLKLKAQGVSFASGSSEGLFERND